MKFEENQAIYLQVADYMIDQILDERWQTGHRIPSVRDIATSMQINPNTVMRSFAFLQDLDIISNKRGVGYFVAESGQSRAQQWKRKEFVEKHAPGFFHQAMTLGVDEDEIITLYREYCAGVPDDEADNR